MDIKAINKIKHNNKLYSPGDIIKKISKEAGERLIDTGAAISIQGVDSNENDKKNKDQK